MQPILCDRILPATLYKGECLHTRDQAGDAGLGGNVGYVCYNEATRKTDKGEQGEDATVDVRSDTE